MKRLVNVVWIVLVIAGLVLAGCRAAPAPAPAPTSAASPTSTTAPAPTVAPVPPTAGPVAAATAAAPAAGGTPAAGSATGETPLYLALVWHQHQPLYYKDPQTGVYTRPWVRVHATKDYYDMAAMLQAYPNVHVTFNLTPVLIRQLDDYAAGAKDVYWTTAEIPANQLTDDNKRFLLTRFFDSNPKIIARFPRYKELSDLRGGADTAKIDAALKSFTEQDYRDLQVLFNLAWFDPGFLAQPPLKALVDKGRNFAEADKAVVFGQALSVIKNVIPIHKTLQDQGQIEVITTPYAHPILPLLYDTNLEKTGNPAAIMPKRFSYPNDAIAQLQKSVEVYRSHFGRDPRGLWPGEGAVSQEIVKMVADSGYQWMASGEIVLAKSLGMDSFTRNSADTVQEADALYRPYAVQSGDAKVNMIFRDQVISDKIGFTYSGMPADAAADDVMQRLEKIRSQIQANGGSGPHLVSIILDGENAWEYYDNDGKDFLNALYSRLNTSQTIKTITPSAYFAQFPQPKPLDKPLFPGAWFSANYDTWIGEDEEAQGWNDLLKTREMLAEYDISKRKTASPDQLARALDFMYLAEGSDWFWWFGSDQDSGDDGYFDNAFRSLLGEVYTSLGQPVPDYLLAPIVAQKPAAPARPVQGPLTPQIDGRETSANEWAQAGMYQAAGGAMARAEDVAATLYYGIDGKNLYLRADARSAWPADATLGIYIKNPRSATTYAFTRATMAAAAGSKTVLGTPASHLVEVTPAGKAQLYTASGIGNAWEAGPGAAAGAAPNAAPSAAAGQVLAAASGPVIELAIPLAALGELQAGDNLRLTAVVSQGSRDLQTLPSGGPAEVVVPDLGNITTVLTVDDPQGDDKGPGNYTYPTDAVFKPGVFDIKQFVAGYDDKNLTFKFIMNGPIENPWGSGSGLSVQTFDVYIDKDPGAGTGNRLLLPGRNAALGNGNGWDVAVWAEGWTPGIFVPDAKGVPQKQNVDPKIIVDAAAHAVTIRVPLSVMGDKFDPAKAGYVGVVLSQDGFPGPGVWRVRDVEAQAAQWRLGGAPGDTNHTRIVDVAWPADGQPAQAGFLGKYPGTRETNMDSLGPDDFAQVPELTVK